MNWYKVAQIQVNIVMEKYKESLIRFLQELANHTNTRVDELNQFKYEETQLINLLNQVQFPDIQGLLQAVKTNNRSAIMQFIFKVGDLERKFDKQFYDNWKNTNYGTKPSIDYRQTFKTITEIMRNLRDREDYEPMTDEYVQQNFNELVQQTYQNMQLIAQKISNIISVIPDWSGTPILIEARELDKNSYVQPQDTASVIFGGDSEDYMTPSFTYFMNSETGKDEIDDILEGGDEEFFPPERGNIQMDYFNLVKEIRNPGSSTKAGKMITLYTARPTKDRNIYIDATAIPSNLFLTSSYDRAEGIAIDLGGSDKRRDVWKIRIDSRYLVKTLDDGRVQDYQAIGNGQIPIKSIELISEGE